MPSSQQLTVIMSDTVIRCSLCRARPPAERSDSMGQVVCLVFLFTICMCFVEVIAIRFVLFYYLVLPRVAYLAWDGSAIIASVIIPAIFAVVC